MTSRTAYIACAIVVVSTGPAHAGDLIWDFGPKTGEYRGTWTNETFDTNRADEVVFDEFVELTGIDIWTSVSAPAGDMHIKILFDNGWGEPGEDYVRMDIHADRYEFDGRYGEDDLYKVSFDLPPIQLRAHTTYWVGVSGNGWQLGQSTLDAPGDGWHARFDGYEFERLTSFGDQMFQLRGRAVFPPFELTIDGACPGEITANVIGATPGGRVAFIQGDCDGETTVPGGPCAGTVLPVAEARLINVVRADKSGNASLAGALPDFACGRMCMVALDLDSCGVSTVGRTYRQPKMYTGARIDNAIGFADFDNSSKYFLLTSYDEGDMNFRYVHQDLPGFRGHIYCGGNGTSSLYMGGPRDMMGITRVDGEAFDAIEFDAGDGWSANCPFTYLWVRAYLDGIVIADYTIDLPRTQSVGFHDGQFDELRVGGYSTAASRDIAYENRDERSLQALALENARFGSISPALTLGGECPGVMTAEVTSATPHDEVAFIAGTCDQQTILPTGPCAGTVLPVGRAQLVSTARADAEGIARLTGNTPASACGRVCVIALDIQRCAVSNSVPIE